MDLQELARSAHAVEQSVPFSHGGHTFDVRLRSCSRGEVDRARRKYQTVTGRGRNTQPDFDWPKLRQWLASHCILGWDNLSWRKALCLANFDPASVTSNGATPKLDEDVPFESSNVLWMLEQAYGFEEFVWETILEVSGEREQVEAAEKKI